MDESGSGAAHTSFLSLWTTAAVAVPAKQQARLAEGMLEVRQRYFQPYCREVKGSSPSRHLLEEADLSDVVADVACLAREVDVHAWCATTGHGVNVPSNFPDGIELPKDITRQFILERVNGFLNLGHYEPHRWQVVWDLSDYQELDHFSRAVTTFRDAYSGRELNDRLVPGVLAGVSHEWTGLQLADVFANFALNKVGCDRNLSRASRRKARLFEEHLLPLLQRDARGRVIGWKVW